jgi:hypothetical protein
MQNRYEDDPILGHRLYREIRRVEQVKKEPGKRSKGKRASTPPVVSYQWETVASSFDEFDDVAVSFEYLIYDPYSVLFLLSIYIRSFFWGKTSL